MFKTKFELMNHGDVFFNLIRMEESSIGQEVFGKMLDYYCQEKVISELINQR